MGKTQRAKIDPDLVTLWAAAQHNDVDAISRMLQGGVDPNGSTPLGDTALHIAVHSNAVRVVGILIAHSKIEINRSSRHGGVPLHIAAHRGHAAVVAALLKHPKCDPNFCDSNVLDGRTPLMLAVQERHESVVAVLLRDSRSNPNVQSTNGLECCALHLAATKGDVKIVKRLLDHPAVERKLCTWDGTTPLMAAVHYNHPLVVQSFLDSTSHAQSETSAVLCWVSSMQPPEQDRRSACIEQLKSFVQQSDNCAEAPKLVIGLAADREHDAAQACACEQRQAREDEATAVAAALLAEEEAEKAEPKKTKPSRGKWGKAKGRSKAASADEMRRDESSAGLEGPTGRDESSVDLERQTDPESSQQDAEVDAGPAVGALPSLSLADVGDIIGRYNHDKAPESSIGGETTCIVCFTNPKSHLAVACGHQSVCGSCSSKMDLCPYCREPVMKWVHVRVV